MHWCPGNAHTKRPPASAGTLGERGRGGPFRLTSTEARLFIGDGGRGGGEGGGGGGGVKARPRIPPERPERPWTAARTTEVLRRCPLAIAQRLVHCAIAVSTAVQGSHKDNVRCTAVKVKVQGF